MNTIARSLDALLGPAMSRRPRKRSADAMEDDELKPALHARKKLRQVSTSKHDADFYESAGNVDCPCARATCCMRARASSTKHLSILAAQQQSLEMLNFSRLDSCVLPPFVNVMVMNIRQHAKGIDTIPASLKSQVLLHDLDLHPDDNVWRPDAPSTEDESEDITPDSNILPSVEPSMTPTAQSAPSCALPFQAHSRTLHFPQVEMIIEQARECSDNNDSEAGWNSQVHGPLLLLACNLSRHRANVKSINMTNARPLRYLELEHQIAAAGKMVDFGLYLQSDDKLKAAFRKTQPEADGQSRYFNHTGLEQIARKPLAISIETQREGLSGHQADLQLGVWMKLHLARLADIRRTIAAPEGQKIWLPSLKAVGPVWYFLLACGKYNDSGELTCTTIYSKHQLGDVTTYHGFFQVLSTLLELIDWAETEYRPWFEDWVSSDTEAGEDAV